MNTNPSSQPEQHEDHPLGYGLWLSLIGIYIFVNFLFALSRLTGDWLDENLFSLRALSGEVSFSREVSGPVGISKMYGVNYTPVMYNLALVFLSGCALWFFIKRKARTKWWILAFLTVNLLYHSLGNLYLLQAGKEITGSFYRSVLMGLLTIPYLLISNRARRVFVR